MVPRLVYSQQSRRRVRMCTCSAACVCICMYVCVCVCVCSAAPQRSTGRRVYKADSPLSRGVIGRTLRPVRHEPHSALSDVYLNARFATVCQRGCTTGVECFCIVVDFVIGLEGRAVEIARLIRTNIILLQLVFAINGTRNKKFGQKAQ